jgi:hypothetical protein
LSEFESSDGQQGGAVSEKKVRKYRLVNKGDKKIG